MSNYGERIRQLRAEKHLSQAKLGKMVGLKQQHIYLIEKGDRRIHLDMARKVADVFGVTVDELFADETPEPA